MSVVAQCECGWKFHMHQAEELVQLRAQERSPGDEMTDIDDVATEQANTHNLVCGGLTEVTV